MTEATISLSPPTAPHWLVEHQREEGESVSDSTRQTTLSVLFNEESKHLFSAVRIVLCCRSEMSEEKWRGWVRILFLRLTLTIFTALSTKDIQQLGPVIHSSRGNVREPEDDILNDWESYLPLPNVSALPKCTVVFEVVHHEATGPLKLNLQATGKLLFRPTDYAHLLNQDSIHIFLECERSPQDTQSVSFHFSHSTKLYIPTDLEAESECNDELITPSAFRITRVVRVLTGDTTVPRMMDGGLPTETLLQIFREVSGGLYSGWRRDLLSCALVCHKWSFSLDLLLSDFQVPQNASTRTCPPNIHALGKALVERPALGLSIKHLNTQYFRGPYWHLRNRDDSVSLVAFTSDLIAILHTARNLQSLELLYLDGNQTEALANALYGLRKLSTFSTGQNNSVYPGDDGVITIVQLAYCLGSWPSLKYLNMHGAQSPTMTEPTTPLRPPVCALTELTIENVSMTGRELMHMVSSSLRTLERVTLDSISGLTNAWLRKFLAAISQNVSSLTIRHTGVSWGAGAGEEQALNATIGKMRRLELLDVVGDVATELMLHRRTEMYSASRADGDRMSGSALPVIQLRFHNVAGLPVSVAAVDWPGWKIFKPYTGPRCGGVHRGYSAKEWEARSIRPVGYLRTILGGTVCSSMSGIH